MVNYGVQDVAQQIMALVQDGYDRGYRAGVKSGLIQAQETVTTLLPEPRPAIDEPDDITTEIMAVVP